MGEQGMNVCAVCNCFNLPHFTPADKIEVVYVKVYVHFVALPTAVYNRNVSTSGISSLVIHTWSIVCEVSNYKSTTVYLELDILDYFIVKIKVFAS